MLGLEIVDYLDAHWMSVCEVHDRARPIELQGSCDERAFIPLSEDTSDLDNFSKSSKHVALLEGRVVGFVGTIKSEVTWLYVDPSEFGNGIGRALLRKGLKSNTDCAHLFVLGGNVAAIALYKSEGFSVVKSTQEQENGYDCTVLELSQK